MLPHVNIQVDSGGYESDSAGNIQIDQNVLYATALMGYACAGPCADPECFVRGGPTLTTFFFSMRGKRIQIALKAGHHRPASEMPFKWRFAGGSMKAQH